MGLLTKEEYEKYINRLALDNETHIPKWSEPIYICPKCGGGMRKNSTCAVEFFNNKRNFRRTDLKVDSQKL